MHSALHACTAPWMSCVIFPVRHLFSSRDVFLQLLVYPNLLDDTEHTDTRCMHTIQRHVCLLYEQKRHARPHACANACIYTRLLAAAPVRGRAHRRSRFGRPTVHSGLFVPMQSTSDVGLIRSVPKLWQQCISGLSVALGSPFGDLSERFRAATRPRLLRARVLGSRRGPCL